MRLPRTDPEAQQLLQELDSLQAAAERSEAAPPALIDQAVRNMARRELQQPAPPIAGKLRWIAGLSTVSIALIALGISLIQSPQIPPRVPTQIQGPADSPMKSKGIELDSLREEAAERPQPAAPTSHLTAIQATEDLARAASPAQAEMQASDASEASQPGESIMAETRSAETWLDLIQQLHDQGLHTEAREQLQAFERDYPDFPLPDWAMRLQRK